MTEEEGRTTSTKEDEAAVNERSNGILETQQWDEHEQEQERNARKRNISSSSWKIDSFGDDVRYDDDRSMGFKSKSSNSSSIFGVFNLEYLWRFGRLQHYTLQENHHLAAIF
ncbi:unnamed protein product [Vicia faba]|uniref:Uncharacterized protein n=1 Tax=Vicia faba TaxID=3906 RepID=A0AAV0YEG8_VICFA|nr:unnamed protein product [Vicia faba]